VIPKTNVEIAEKLTKAAKEMEDAPPPLRKETADAARTAGLQTLLAADSIFRGPVAFGNQSGGGQKLERQQQELPDCLS
jgi:hypothetical protein